MTQDVKLSYVIVDGELHKVSEYSDIVPSNRPKALCPECREEVIMKLGSVYRHHYAHKVDGLCITTNKETAMHIEVKNHIYYELQKTNSLKIIENCIICQKRRYYEWIKNWTEVKIEHSIDNIRPDIVLLKEGKEIGGIEVAVTHEVDNQKEIKYKELGLKWIEIYIDDNNFEDIRNWKHTERLPINKNGNLDTDEKKWICLDCLKRIEEEYKRNNYTRINSFMAIDFYNPDGKVIRDIVYLKEVFKDGKEQYAFLEMENKNKRYKKTETYIYRKFPENLYLLYLKQIKEKKRKKNIIVDYSNWNELYELGGNIVNKEEIPKQIYYKEKNKKYKYRWDKKTENWVDNKKIKVSNKLSNKKNDREHANNKKAYERIKRAYYYSKKDMVEFFDKEEGYSYEELDQSLQAFIDVNKDKNIYISPRVEGRLLKCEKCNKYKIEKYMVSYKRNTGLCRKCLRKNNK